MNFEWQLNVVELYIQFMGAKYFFFSFIIGFYPFIVSDDIAILWYGESLPACIWAALLM